VVLNNGKLEVFSREVASYAGDVVAKLEEELLTLTGDERTLTVYEGDDRRFYAVMTGAFGYKRVAPFNALRAKEQMVDYIEVEDGMACILKGSHPRDCEGENVSEVPPPSDIPIYELEKGETVGVWPLKTSRREEDRRLVYEFWADDIPTQIAIETLKELEIPFETEEERRVRDPSAPEDIRYDNWLKIYVNSEDLVTWLERRIDKEINSY